MAFTSRKNRIAQQFLPNSQVVLPIAPNLAILSGKVILTGTVTVSGGTTNGTVFAEGGPVNLIKRIRIVANAAAGSPYPNGWIVDCSARSLLRWAQINSRHGLYIGEQSGSVLGNGAAGTYPIYLEIPILFADQNLRQQVQTALYADPSAYQSIQCQVFTGDITSCFTGNDRTVVYNLQVQWQDSRANIIPPATATVLFQEDHIVQIGAANARLNDPAMPQDGAFLSWTILAEQGAQQVLSDAIFQQLTIEGPSFDFQEYAADMRAEMYDAEWINPSANAAGIYHLDMTEGIIQNSNPAAQLQVYTQVANPSGAYLDQLRLFTRRYYVVQAGS